MNVYNYNMQAINQISERKQKIQNAVSKAPAAFLKKIVSNRSSYDPDLRIAAHFELQNRGMIQ